MTTRAALLGGLGLGLVGLGFAGAAPSLAGAVSPAAPTIKINPDNVMVNTDTQVVGQHFSAGQTLTLVECGKKSWVVPKNPCDSDNTVTVATNTKGAFKTAMKVEDCPGKAHPPGLEQTCYIGVEKFGIDTGSLQPFASIVVTFP